MPEQIDKYIYTCYDDEKKTIHQEIVFSGKPTLVVEQIGVLRQFIFGFYCNPTRMKQFSDWLKLMVVIPVQTLGLRERTSDL